MIPLVNLSDSFKYKNGKLSKRVSFVKSLKSPSYLPKMYNIWYTP
jgi:hypothetical protein